MESRQKTMVKNRPYSSRLESKLQPTDQTFTLSATTQQSYLSRKRVSFSELIRLEDKEHLARSFNCSIRTSSD